MKFAAAGYIAVAPDLLSGFGPNGGGSSEFPSQDATTKAVSSLNADIVMSDLDAVADYGKKLPASNGKLAVVGFCWGGGKSFAFATHRQDLTAPSFSTALRRIKLQCPKLRHPSMAFTQATTHVSTLQFPIRKKT